MESSNFDVCLRLAPSKGEKRQRKIYVLEDNKYAINKRPINMQINLGKKWKLAKSIFGKQKHWSSNDFTLA